MADNREPSPFRALVAPCFPAFRRAVSAWREDRVVASEGPRTVEELVAAGSEMVGGAVGADPEADKSANPHITFFDFSTRGYNVL